MKDNKTFGIKVVVLLILLMFLTFALSFWTQNTEHKVIKEQLEAIQDKRFTEAYYAFTSKEFQAVTTLEEFKKFIKNFPLFTENKILEFEDSSKPGKINLALRSDDEEMHLMYTLTKNGEEWRVKEIEVVSTEHLLKDVPEFDTTLFLTPVKEHLEGLKSGNLKDTYEDTAEDFQSTTPFKEFEDFIRSFPILTQFESVDYYKLSFNNNLGMYHIKLVGQKGETYEAQFDLIKENGKWKILQIQISDKPL